MTPDLIIWFLLIASALVQLAAFLAIAWVAFEALAALWHAFGKWPLRTPRTPIQGRMMGGRHRTDWAGARWP